MTWSGVTPATKVCGVFKYVPQNIYHNSCSFCFFNALVMISLPWRENNNTAKKEYKRIRNEAFKVAANIRREVDSLSLLLNDLHRLEALESPLISPLVLKRQYDDNPIVFYKRLVKCEELRLKNAAAVLKHLQSTLDVIDMYPESDWLDWLCL